jgi:hypothetical protein
MLNKTGLKKHIDCRFANLGAPDRIFAIPSIHGHLQKLHGLHESIYAQFQPGDRIVYLGNYTGYGPHSRQTIDAILNFRRCLLAIPGVKPTDIVFIRGTQEEMWQKLMQLQFAPNPSLIMDWMLGRGLAQTLESYGMCLYEAQRIAHEGVIRISRWTQKLRLTIHDNAGHDIFGAQLKRAAYTDCAYTQSNTCSPLLFVNAGVDFTKPLEEQGDCLWWGNAQFSSIKLSYSPYRRVFRGYDPQSGGLHETLLTATLDNDSDLSGDLIYAQIGSNGDILDICHP